ncbi:hypothetical protein PMN44_11000, partial [Bifidobacterium longum]|nr:hypothetical protein [Bifidobacterium longum]MDB6546639.1 hypothetical protein [Bifidobacterium longum]MDB6553129.1 hypothetical protein [Bifidobacterium longum]MDB6557409.1 hypothetical protein [Bifidobacterium longum]MDB6559570.1 hypothetical protein [Bifidobacterium longum]
RGDGQATIKTSRPETSRCTYKLNPGKHAERTTLKIMARNGGIPHLSNYCPLTKPVPSPEISTIRPFSGVI